MKYCIAYPYLGESKEVRGIVRGSNPEKILARTCKFYGVSELDVVSKTRKREVCQVRQIIMHIMHNNTGLSLKSIGEIFNNRDHTTVIHAKKAVRDMYDTDPVYKTSYDGLVKYLNIVPLGNNVERSVATEDAQC